MWFSARTRFVVVAAVATATSVALGLFGGDWTPAGITAVLIGIGAWRFLRRRREDPDRCSTPELWGRPPAE